MTQKINLSFVVGILKDLDIFADLDDAALMELGYFFKERIYEHNEVIFEEASIGNSMMVIASGEVRVTQKADTKAEEALVVLKKGDIFGEMALFEDLPRSAATIAHTSAIVLEIKREDFFNYIRKDTASGVKVLLKLGQILSSRLRETDVKLKAFISMSQWL